LNSDADDFLDQNKMAESTLPTQLVSSAYPHLVSEQTAREYLHLFTFELPDPEIQLYIQLGKDLDSFTLFQKLPLELRLKIWRSTFPKPRFVSLGRSCIGPSCKVCHHEVQRDQHTPLPVTLGINSESRIETLKCYTVVLRQGEREERGQKDKRRRLIYFDHLRDKIYLADCCYWNSEELLDWVEWLNSKALGRLEKVKSLEFNGVGLRRDLNEHLKDRISGSYDKHLATCPGRYCGFLHNPILDCVLKFSGIRSFDFWLTGEDYWNKIEEDKEGILEEYRALLQTYFEIHKGRFDGGKAPEVRVFHTFELYGRGELAGRAVENVDWQRPPNYRFST
jgi:hypothetical protein